MPEQSDTTRAFQYLGKHSRGVDKSRRVMLPSEWRLQDWPSEFWILLWPAEAPEFLLVLPPKRWEKTLEKVGESSITDKSKAAIQRFISSNSYPKSLDTYGRLPIPDEPAKAVGIGDQAVLLGRMNIFEIWSPERLKASFENDETKKAFDTLNNMDL